MRRTLAIVWLTWKAVWNSRLVWVLSALLLSTVVCVPLILHDDGTARGFIQIVVTYSVGIVTSLLAVATLWLSCVAIARDVEECQIQMVVVKPIGRWQVWIGKWLGIVLLDAFLLTISAGSVYAVLMYRAGKLPAEQQRTLREEILVARAGVREPVEDVSPAVDAMVKQKLKENATTALDVKLLRKDVEEQIKASRQIVPPNYMRIWTNDLGLRRFALKDVPLHARVRFYAAQTNNAGLYLTEWRVAPGTPAEVRRIVTLPANSFQEIAIPPNMIDADGKVTIELVNRSDTVLLFPEEDGMELLYRESTFGVNLMRGMGVILCWMALLAAIGLAASSFLSFPVAAFASLTVLILALSSGAIQQILEAKSALGLVNPNTGMSDNETLFDRVMLPTFRGLLSVIRLAESFSPVDALSTGRSITWGELGQAFGEVVLLLGGLVALVGIFLFTRRELATAQGTS
jgi:hypothetical protein